MATRAAALLTREERNKAGSTVMRVTRATRVALEQLISHRGGRGIFAYGTRARLTVDDVVYELVCRELEAAGLEPAAPAIVVYKRDKRLTTETAGADG